MPEEDQQAIDTLQGDHIGYFLRSACEEGDAVTVSQEVKKQPDSVYARDEDGRTPLLIASTHGYLTIVEILTKNTPLNLDDADSEGTTPLLATSERGHTQVVHLLCALGAQVDRADVDGMTPLFVAAMKGHRDVVEILYRFRADPLAVAGLGQSALVVACARGHVEIVQFFLENLQAGASLVDNHRESLVHIASKNGNQRMVTWLLTNNRTRSLINVRNAAGATPLWLASNRGIVSVISELLLHGAHLNIRHANGTTPLVAASMRGRLGAVRCLVAAGADLTGMREVENAEDTGVLDALLWGSRDRFEPVLSPLVEEALVRPPGQGGLLPELVPLVLEYAMPHSISDAEEIAGQTTSAEVVPFF